MPTLNWIGKEAVVKHHKEVPFRLLEPVPDLSCGDSHSGNLNVQGDNLHALKALLPRYAGQVKCIYIDPPYNTGNEGWVYNDNVNSPEIRKRLGEVVGKEGETLDRHDRWLSMMCPRPVLLKQFLCEDGAIFVSIDDNEVGNLQALMREVFDAMNEIAAVVWEKGKKGDSKLVSITHEYIVALAKDPAGAGGQSEERHGDPVHPRERGPRARSVDPVRQRPRAGQLRHQTALQCSGVGLLPAGGLHPHLPGTGLTSQVR